MKGRFLKIIKWLINSLTNYYEKQQNEELKPVSPFKSLSPIGYADKNNNYFTALKWAIENRKNEDIKNIAIAGPFGSGKSSVLKTFQKRNIIGGIHFLNISLANFNQGKTKGDNKKKEDSEKPDLPRLIELSILQQIFYHEKDRNIPDSRFRKIRSFKTFDLVIKTLVALIFVFSILNIFLQSELLKLLSKIGIESLEKEWLTYVSFLILITGISILIFNSIRSLHSLRVSKFKIKDAEIEVDQSVNKSILNHHLDEILYFFEVTKYNVVVIEDLDRFGQTEIFTKLREINLLINNSEKINKDVVFIYAIRDDMFLDEERTKFFDFVIPIIPVINSSNSNEILLEKKKHNDFTISDILIDDISLFIEDMRVLHNIMNEYYIYHLNLNEKLDQDNLLSMIVYKNLFPNDFTLLSKNKGILFDSINKKKEYLKTEINKIDEQLVNIEKEIAEIESIKIKDVKELRSLYIFRYISKLNQFNAFIINGATINAISALEDDYFSYIISDSVKQYQYYQYNQYRNQNNPVLFENIEAEVDANCSYRERIILIEKWHNKQANKLKQRIEHLENKKQEIKSVPLKKIIKPLKSDSNSEYSKQQLLINVLLRNGYINEDYLDYISIFYEGSLSKQDHQFLINIKSQISTEFDYELIKLDKLIAKINVADFKEDYILNYKLIAHILKNKGLEEHSRNVFRQLCNQTKKSLGFIDGYINNGSNVPLFTKVLCSYWSNIWNYISTSTSYSSEKVKSYLKLILLHSELNDLKTIASESDLIQNLSHEDALALFIGDETRFKEVVEKLEIRFVNLNPTKTTKSVLEFIYNGNHYEFGVNIFKLFLKELGKIDSKTFETKNYQAIKESGCDDLFDLITFHINSYIESVYLKINTNRNESEDNYLEILKNPELDSSTLSKLVDFVDTRVTSISDIENLEIIDTLFEKSKIIPEWNNILIHFENNENSLTSPLFNFLNIETNSAELSRSKIPTDNKEEGENRYRPFILALIKQVGFTNKTYDNILKSIPYVYTTLNFEELDYDKVELLLKNRILSMTVENFNSLKENYTDLHVRLIIDKKNSFIRDIADYNIDHDDVFHLLSSEKLSTNEKNTIVDSIDESLIVSNSNSLLEISELILGNSSFSISKLLFRKILQSGSIDTIKRIKIFMLKQSQLDSEIITDFMNSLNEPFSDITISGKKPLIDYNEENLRLAEILKTEDYISNFKIEEDKGIRIYTFRKQSE